ncbi:GDSL-type esterase/lipase family protein [Rahnella inusitata]|uniref:tail fiber/spike domain-containing protein n=1 Tax=Rahnella inusitata TaxID=58169 RepID=UPI0039BEAEFA
MTTYNTGNPLGSSAPKDLYDNAQNLDFAMNSITQALWEDRFGRSRNTWHGIEKFANDAISAFGYVTIDSFEDGATISLPNEVLRWKNNGEYYRWDGALPKNVTAGSTPDTSGGVGSGKWLSVGYAALSSMIISATGSTGIDSALYDLSTAAYSIRNRRLLGVANNKLRSAQNVKIVCVGDSITYGYDVNSTDVIAPPADNGHIRTRAPIQYPSRLQDRLVKFTKSSIAVINYGFSGDTAKQCFNRWKINPACDVAHIMLGINDAAGANSATFDEYCQYMEMLIRKYIDWGHGVVIHTSTAQTFNNFDSGGARFTQYVRSISKNYGCPVFESEGVHQYCRYAEVYSDNTHFNKAGYAKYGDAVASFILASGWVRDVREISSTTSQQPGRSTEGIGWYGTNGSYIANNEANSYAWHGQTGGITASTGGIHSFSFFLDSDAANIYLIGLLPSAKITLSDPETTAGGLVASNRIQPKFYSKTIKETTKYQVATRPAGYKQWAGSLVGRGWKTVYIEQDVSVATAIFCNQLIIETVTPEEVVQENSGVIPANKEVMLYRVPVVGVSVGQTTLPDPEKMPQRVVMPLPKGLYRQTHYWSSYFDSLKFEMSISTTASQAGSGYNGTRKLLCRMIDNAGNFSIESTYSSTSLCVTPTKVQYGWEDPNDSTGTIHVGYPPTNSPSAKLMYLLIDFADAPGAYFTIELECNAIINSAGNFMY